MAPVVAAIGAGSPPVPRLTSAARVGPERALGEPIVDLAGDADQLAAARTTHR